MQKYSGHKALVTGGLGFIGSNLAIRLVELGANVTIVDSCIEGCGSNIRNIASIAKDVRVARYDIGDAASIRPLLQGTEMVFNQAGEISHSMDCPERDLDLNTRSQMLFLRECGGMTQAALWNAGVLEKAPVSA